MEQREAFDTWLRQRGQISLKTGIRSQTEIHDLQRRQENGLYKYHRITTICVTPPTFVKSHGRWRRYVAGSTSVLH